MRHSIHPQAARSAAFDANQTRFAGSGGSALNGSAGMAEKTVNERKLTMRRSIPA